MMKTLIIVFSLSGIILCSATPGICGNLEDARRRAGDAYDYSGRAANSNDAQSARYYSRQTMSASDDARDLAAGGRSSDAARYAGDAYDYSTRASRTQNARDAQYYSRLAEKSSAETEASIDDTIAKNAAAKAAKYAAEQDRIKSEIAKKRAEDAMAEIEAQRGNETAVAPENKTVESKIMENFGR